MLTKLHHIEHTAYDKACRNEHGPDKQADIVFYRWNAATHGCSVATKVTFVENLVKARGVLRACPQAAKVYERPLALPSTPHPHLDARIYHWSPRPALHSNHLQAGEHF